MFYTIYKITNIINGKIYIGKHQTADLNDGYMGSGKYIKRAIDKYGIENFEKEILFIFDNEEEMNNKEKEIVTEEFVKDITTYNICHGGKGGWSYINYSGLRTKGHNNDMYKKVSASLTGRSNLHSSENMKKLHADGKIKYNTFKNKHHTDETKRKISEANSKLIGENNSQFGTIWITNGQENKKIKKDVDIIPEGWYKEE